MTTEEDVRVMRYVVQSVMSVPHATDPDVYEALRGPVSELTVSDQFAVIGGLAALAYGLAQRLAVATGVPLDDVLEEIGGMVVRLEADL
jgi:hypothetical protein